MFQFFEIIYIDQGSIWGGSDRGLGHGSISENTKWVTYQIAQKWVIYQIFGAEKWVTFRFRSLPPLVGHSPQIEPWYWYIHFSNLLYISYPMFLIIKYVIGNDIIIIQSCSNLIFLQISL